MTTSEAPAWNKKNPFPAKILKRENLNKPGSAKETLHYEIDLQGSGLTYLPGYSLGIFGKNPKSITDELIATLSLNPDFPLPQKDGSTKPLREALATDFTLNRVGKKFIKALAEKLPEGNAKESLTAICADKEKLDEYAFTRDYIDVLKEYPAEFTEEEFTGLLTRQVPRLYSIASSIDKHPGEVHLTIATVRYETHGRKKTGLCSGFLADEAEMNTSSLPVFLAPSKHFHLPENPETPVIMVGPGTGIAPFRAFLEQRETDQAKGKNWLFFGDQHQATDFLYQDEFDAWLASGLLTRLDTAFSRDQEKKIYVQDRMREASAELWKWLHHEKAYFYVCGDAKRMAKDVEQALIDIAAEHGNMSPEDAKIYITKTLAREERRYLKDVY